MDTTKIDETGQKMVDNVMNSVIEELSSDDFYSRFIQELEKGQKNGDIPKECDLNQYSDSSGFMIPRDELKVFSELLSSSFLQRFYFTKKDCGQE